jgi:ParB family chromosome partitioning protein
MAEEARRRNLGRGLNALFDEGQDDALASTPANPTASPAIPGTARPAAAGVHSVPIEFVRPGRYQPRHRMDAAEIDELSKSIREFGILQPILVRRDRDHAEAYEIIAGERRWRAAQKAQLHEVPIIVRDFSDAEALEVALVENLQREDLSPLEEAQGYDRLMREFAHTQEGLAKILGKSRSHVANMMRLLNLPEPVKAMLDAGELSAGHARALLNDRDPVKTAKAVVRRGLNVRQTERLVQRGKAAKSGRRSRAGKDADTLALERDVSQLLGLAVGITFTDPGGAVTIQYNSLEQLDDILHRLTEGARGKIAAVADGNAAAEDAAVTRDAGAANDDGAGSSASSNLDIEFEASDRGIDDPANHRP